MYIAKDLGDIQLAPVGQISTSALIMAKPMNQEEMFIAQEGQVPILAVVSHKI